MASRFERLKAAIANLAAPPEAQVKHLDRLFGSEAEGYGSDELALEFSDIFVAASYMQDLGEIEASQIEVIGRLDTLLAEWSGAAHADFWTREALFTDPRWNDVRAAAVAALALM